MIALTAIYGIGRTRSQAICAAAGVNAAAKIKDLTDAEVEKLREQVAKITVEGDLRRETTMSIKRLMDFGCGRAPSAGFAVSWSAHAHQCAYPQRPAQGDCRCQEVELPGGLRD